MAENITSPAVVRFPPSAPFGCDHRLYPHVVQFYLTDDFLLNIICNFIVSACKTRDGIVIVATKSHREGILERLALLGIDVAALKLAGSYVEMDAEETLEALMVNEAPDFACFDRLISGALTGAKAASDATDSRLMVFGEMVALLFARRKLEAALAVEKFWAILGSRYSFSLLCGYSMKEFAEPGTEESFLRICAQHATVSSPEAYATAESEQRILRITAQSYADASFLRPA
jgi:hypothetical protein